MSLDCTTCGACCVSPFPGQGYIPLQGDEPERLHRLALPVFTLMDEPGEEPVILLGTKKFQNGRRCCFLFTGEVGKPCRCTRYDQRPMNCRWFEADSPECHQARRALGLE